jgi:hypothetical protein
VCDQDNRAHMRVTCARVGQGMVHRRDHNVTRRLTRMLKECGMPRTGGAHWLRMRYVQLTHALLILQGQCTRGRIVMAMRELLEGWADTEEEHSYVGGYQHRLLNAIDDLQFQIETWAWADVPVGNPAGID